MPTHRELKLQRGSGTWRSSRQLEHALRATKAADEPLEAAVAEPTEHLLAAHEKLRQFGVSA